MLVVCGHNKRRSRTAESLFKNDDRMNIRSAGLSPPSNRRLTESDIKWADSILVMEKRQKDKILELYRDMEIATIDILDIPDDYDYMDEELAEMLLERIPASINHLLKA